MGLPTRALRDKQLNRLTAGPVVPSSGHIVEKVTFTDLDGEKKLGFFKALDPTYPELLAKLSVLSSVFARLVLGDRAAEDRLVFDDANRIIGTVSVALKDFKALNFSHAIEPTIPSEREKVIPSTQTLLENNVMELLIVSWFLGNDDLHPGNLSLKGLIDWDMYLYWITVWIKGPRIINGWLTGTPPKGINISTRDFQNFPFVQDANFTHWVTKYRPENWNYAKAYPDYKAFIELARNPQLHNSKEDIYAQDQLFTAVLKVLLTWQPDVLHARLEEYFGALLLNYSSLDSATVTNLENASSKLFNSERNQQTFIDFAMELYQQHYDALYRTTVFYKGCKQNGQGASEPLFPGVAVPSFCEMLHAKPSMYQNIKQWAITQNQHLDKHCQFNLEQLEQRYHQIFRDALVPEMNSALSLSAELALQLRKLQSLNPISPMETAINPTDSTVTTSLKLFGHLHPDDVDAVEKDLDCDKNSDLRKGTLELVRFNNSVHEYVTEYFGKEHKNLARNDNIIFIHKMNMLILKYKTPITVLLKETSWKQKFIGIIQELQHFCNIAEFDMHIDARDRPVTTMTIPRKNSEKHIPAHTDPEIVRRCVSCLFDWVNALPPDQLQSHINNVITHNYSSLFNWYRQREHAVNSWLKHSQKINGENRLAYILCSGTAETGALNVALVKALITLMLKESPQVFGVHFPGIEKALEAKEFDKELYTKEAIEYARKDERFTQLCMHSAPSLIHQAIFTWVNGLSDATFAAMAKAAVNHHDKNKSYVAWSRKSEVNDCLGSNLSKAKKLACILSNRGWEEHSVNTFLYKSIVQAMQREKAHQPDLTKADQLILQLYEDHYSQNYFAMIVEFCKLKLQEKEKPEVKMLMY